MVKKVNEFAEFIEEDEIAVPVPQADSGLIQARVKGTWQMHWGQKVYNFEDSKSYNIPKDLYDHLKNYSNIYDTL